MPKRRRLAVTLARGCPIDSRQLISRTVVLSIIFLCELYVEIGWRSWECFSKFKVLFYFPKNCSLMTMFMQDSACDFARTWLTDQNVPVQRLYMLKNEAMEKNKIWKIQDTKSRPCREKRVRVWFIFHFPLWSITEIINVLYEHFFRNIERLKIKTRHSILSVIFSELK